MVISRIKMEKEYAEEPPEMKDCKNEMSRNALQCTS